MSFEDYLYGREETPAEEEPAPAEPNPEDVISPEEEEEIGLYGKKPVSTEREILEDFVIPTFRGFGFDSADEQEETEEDDYYNPNGYKMKSFGKKTEPAWMSEDDDDDEFGRPAVPVQDLPSGDTFDEPDDEEETEITIDEPELPAEEPESLMDDEPELPMDEEPDLPMDDEPELPMDEEPDIPMDEEPDLPMVDEPDLPMEEEAELPMEDEPEAPYEEASPFVYYAAPEIPVEDDEPELPKEETEAAPEAPAPVKTDDDDRLKKLKEKLAEIRQRNSEKYGNEEPEGGEEDFF